MDSLIVDKDGYSSFFNYRRVSSRVMIIAGDVTLEWIGRVGLLVFIFVQITNQYPHPSGS